MVVFLYVRELIGLDSKRSAGLADPVAAAASLDTCFNFHGRVPVCEGID